MKILIVGGTFDESGGGPSSLITAMTDIIQKTGNADTDSVNGGNYGELNGLLDKTPDYDIVFWFANVPNELAKIRDIKSVAPKTMLVTSKRNDDGKYSINELIQRALGSKSNLLFEFSKNASNGLFHMRVIDPLGCLWYEGDDISDAVNSAMTRLAYLRDITRQGTVKSNVDKSLVLSWYFDSFKMDEHRSDKKITIPDRIEFVGLIRKYAEKLQKAMPDIKIERFLGNASMKLPPQIGRCGKTMPSFKKDGVVFVSRRNVPKQFIEMGDFVPVYMEGGKLYYCGDNKPSVDSPVQIRLYEALPNIRYMIHTHSYLPSEPTTELAIPCGAVEEVDEVLKTIDRSYESRTMTRYAINLKGHGSIIMGYDISDLRGYDFTPRPFPEDMR